MNLSGISKAVAGGIVGLVVAEAARYGLRPSSETVSLIGVVVTALVGYVVGHIGVYLAPANKPVVPTPVPPLTNG